MIGAAPSYDSDPAGQIRRVFELAREFDVDIDMHVDSGSSAEHLDTRLVCELTEQYGWGGRVACGHLTKLSVMPLPELDAMARRMADAGVALTVSALRALRRGRTSASPTRAASHLVTNAAFAISRNPIYVGMFAALAALLLAAPNALTMLLCGLGWVLIHVQTRLEEEHLARLHGDEYDAYRRRVRRWL